MKINSRKKPVTQDFIMGKIIGGAIESTWIEREDARIRNTILDDILKGHLKDAKLREIEVNVTVQGPVTITTTASWEDLE